MPWVAAAAAAAAAIGGGVIGAIERSSANDDAKSMIQKALEAYNSAGMPPETALPIILQEFSSAGVITPELEQEINLNASKVSQIQEDPSLRQAGVDALNLIKQRAKTGLSPEDRATFNKLRSEINQDAEGKRQQIIQNFAARGQGGAGPELAAQLLSSQGSAQQASEEGDRISSGASQAALNAILASEQMGSRLRGQDFDIARSKAEAEDTNAITQFNNATSRQMRNIAAKNQAQETNLANKQNIMNVNTQQANDELRRQNTARAADWQNKVNYLSGQANILTGQANQRRQEGEQAAQSWAQGGSAVGSMIGSYNDNQQRQKLLDRLYPEKQQESTTAAVLNRGYIA